MRQAPIRSITGTLIVSLTLGLTLVWLLSSAVSTAILEHELAESFDHGLVETAHRLLPLAIDSLEDDDHHRRDDEHGPREIRHFRADADRGMVYQVRDANGALVLRSDDAPSQPFAASLAPGFSEGGAFRIFTLLDPESGIAIQVGQPLADRREALAGSMATLALPLLVLIPLIIAGVWFAIRRGLRPLTRLQAEIAMRDSANLAPLAIGGLPRELTPIAGALDRLIDRLRSAFEAERSFAANSAHELRTPIAAALAQTQRLIETTRDEQARSEGRKIEATLRRLADLGEKLIQLSRAEAGMAATGEPAAVAAVLQLVVEDCRARSRPARNIVLTIAPEATAYAVRVNVDALAIVLRNLLHNALAHSPPDTPVEVEITPDRRLVFRNSGPAVPEEALARLRRRFERGATNASGSGLGLAIVETILAQVGGELRLHSPVPGRADGFEAEVVFPPF